MRMEERQEEQQEIRRGRKSGVQAITIFHGITFLDFLEEAREPRPVFISSSGFLDKKGKRKMNTIKRDVYVLRNTIKIPIEVTKGTDMLGLEFAVRDYEIPATAAAVAYVYHKSMDKPKGTLCDVDNSVISFTPSGDFFVVGMNELQIRVINDGKSLISFKEKIKCSDAMGFPDDEEESQQTLVEQLLTKVGKEEGDRKTADDTEREERIAADDAEKKARIAEENARAEADEAIRANRIVTLDEIDLVTEEGFFVDALAVKELNSNLTKANNDITAAINNIIKNVEITKTNLKVAANSDFRWTWDLPTIPGYYPLEVLAWNFHGDYDLWLNVSTAARYSTSNQFGIEGHNFGNGTATVTLFVHILYVKNGFCSYVKA